MIIGKSLTALGGGGLKPEITVTAKAGALLNLHFKDSSIILQSYRLGEAETQHTFVVNVSDTAYVIEDDTNGTSVEVLVDSVAQYSVSPKRLPTGYTELEYIESSGRTQYIGGLVILANDIAEIAFMHTSSETDERAFYGRVGHFELYFENGIYHAWSGIEAISPASDTSYSRNQKIIFRAKHTKDVTGDYNGRLFTYRTWTDQNATSYNTYYVTGRMYYYKLKRNGTDVYNFVPCQRDSDGSVGMFDTVSKTFFGNSGTGSFIAGNPV